MIKLFLAQEFSSQLAYQIIIDYHHFKSVSLGKFRGVCLIFCNLSKSFKRFFGFRISMSWHPEWPIEYSIWEWRCRMCRMPTNGNHQNQSPMAIHGNPPWQPLTCFKIFWTSVRSQYPRSRADIDWSIWNIFSSFVVFPKLFAIATTNSPGGIDHPQLHIAPPNVSLGSWRLRQNHA